MLPASTRGLAFLLLPLVRGQGPFMEIEFEPMNMGPGPMDDRVPPELLQDLLSGMPRPPSVAGTSGPDIGAAKREGQLDQAMAGLLGGGGPRSGGSRGPEVFIEEIPMPSKSRSKMPVNVFHDLFPGPLMMEEDGADPLRGMPFGGPDPLILDMLQGMGRSFHQDLLPAVHRTGGSRAPRSCHADLKKHCSKERSQVHCLGQHQEDISEACRKDVGKSVPFICSRSIDRYCDVLQTGILQCLGGHLQDLDNQCRDAVVATQHLISKANTQKALVKVSEQQTGQQLPTGSTGSPGAVALLTASSKPNQGADSQKLLDSTADLVAEAMRENKGLSHLFQEEEWRQARRRWLLLLLVLAAAAAYVCLTADGSRRVRSALKPFVSLGEDSTPLRSGVELPKALAV